METPLKALLRFFFVMVVGVVIILAVKLWPLESSITIVVVSFVGAIACYRKGEREGKKNLVEDFNALKAKENAAKADEDEVIVEARICADLSSSSISGFEAIKLLKDAGIRTSATSISAMVDPEIYIDYPKRSVHVEGLEELKRFLNTQRILT